MNMGYVTKYFQLTPNVVNVVPCLINYVYICSLWIYVSRPKTNPTVDTHKDDVMVATSLNQPPQGEFSCRLFPGYTTPI